MNVMIIDTKKIDLDIADDIYCKAIEISGTSDWLALPRGIEVMEDVPIEWLKHIRDIADEKINSVKE
jgi:hypothetical protein